MEMDSIKTRTYRLTAITAALGIGLAACASPSPTGQASAAGVPTYRGNAARTGEMVGPGPRGEHPAVAWEFEADGPFSNSPVVENGTVFAASGEGRIHALDLKTGQEHWATDIGANVSASPLLMAGFVIVGDENGTVHALKATDGTPGWTATVDGAITGSPAAVGDDVIVATMGTHAYRLEAATGKQIWSTDVGGETTRSVTVDDDTAYLGLGGELLAIGLDDGKEHWRTTVGQSGNVGTPTIAGDLVYAATGLGGEPADAGVAAIDAATGEIRWQYASPERVVIYTPAVVDGRAYVLGHDRRVVAMEAATGKQLWTKDFEHDLEALPSIVGDTLYVVGNDGPAAALDAATGDERWSVDISGIPFAPAIAEGYLLVGTDIGHLYAIAGS
jgi:outer membrane protein assembly factor BamB